MNLWNIRQVAAHPIVYHLLEVEQVAAVLRHFGHALGLMQANPLDPSGQTKPNRHSPYSDRVTSFAQIASK
jgi:hypothetical protein